MARQIKTQPDKDYNKIIISGWFQGKNTYLWNGDKEKKLLGILSGQKLYRLAKAIVKQFEISK